MNNPDTMVTIVLRADNGAACSLGPFIYQAKNKEHALTEAARQEGVRRGSVYGPSGRVLYLWSRL